MNATLFSYTFTTADLIGIAVVVVIGIIYFAFWPWDENHED